MEPLHNSLPGLTGGEATILAAVGTIVVDTGLMDVQSFACALAQDSVANAASLSWEYEAEVAGTTRKVEIKGWKADGATASSVDAKVSWVAIGR